MWWLSGEDPVKMKEFEQMPLMTYLFFLDQKIESVNREISRMKNVKSTLRTDYG